ncbi:cysteine-rich receptor-like protein kinase 15 [Arabidopsis lyrata subsp. lyrata]|uniref:cysteine-rich receptor-like protein kinase 15 n=1 Tax=Arabidopsis lyrata subsp. lyrata TaxID=81972 RepID=UPI000A29C2E5|nr:cysteine-rich receptor-like protein kinase 15 [Arabidopsis lyrata subsp. lyrata]|eukprot:XP_020873614.1 cysteine-rich receptor-like protein kinase 15 [Arabidopsis lyrata subsp. lyrata]
MTSCASFIFLFLFSFLTSFTASAQNIFYIQHICPNTTTYSRNSTYFTNLRTLLSSLSSPNASYSTGFQNATAGQAPDRVTGLFLCRGDVSSEVCRKCVAISINDTLTQCPNEMEAVFYYDECMLRYSDRNILSTLAYDGAWFRLNGNISIDQNQMNRFKDFVSSTMNQAALEAASNATKFYTIKANWTALQTLYGLVQCTPDLTRHDCLSCLESFINVMPLYKTGGRFLYPSCNLRYELFAFYNESAVRTQPQQQVPPPPLPPASTPPMTSASQPGELFLLEISITNRNFLSFQLILDLLYFCLPLSDVKLMIFETQGKVGSQMC